MARNITLIILFFVFIILISVLIVSNYLNPQSFETTSSLGSIVGQNFSSSNQTETTTSMVEQPLNPATVGINIK